MRETLLKIGFPVWQADGLLKDYAHYRRNEATAVPSELGSALIASGVQDAIGKNRAVLRSLQATMPRCLADECC
ncbi:hypothetical protein [Leptolyngbya sp. FACHB-541]|uniref:hypothetical protein n=1 Tax=Leptolyngbya sp. FACHB-541 TaxID=2692810 RepID=UPI001F5546B5|nr:hypothetical protein [Leptolyngbya sp. FACHB-541]